MLIIAQQLFSYFHMGELQMCHWNGFANFTFTNVFTAAFDLVLDYLPLICLFV